MEQSGLHKESHLSVLAALMAVTMTTLLSAQKTENVELRGEPRSLGLGLQK